MGDLMGVVVAEAGQKLLRGGETAQLSHNVCG